MTKRERSQFYLKAAKAEFKNTTEIPAIAEMLGIGRPKNDDVYIDQLPEIGLVTGLVNHRDDGPDGIKEYRVIALLLCHEMTKN